MKKSKIILHIVLFIVIGICINCLFTKILLPKTMHTTIIKGIYEEPENSLDVAFIGDSSIYEGISPMEIWNKHGVASYDFASPTQKIWDSYYVIEEILKYQKPKLIVLNVEQLFSGKPMKEGYKRHLYDNMEYGKNKLEAITDDVQKNSKLEQLSYILPILRFHSRWSSLEKKDFENIFEERYIDERIYKGYWVIKEERPYDKTKEDKPKKLENKINENALSYLEKIKEICKSNNIQLLLLAVPIPKTWNDERHQEVEKWAQNNEIPFLDTNYVIDEMQIDWKTDTPDNGTHLNIHGAKKVSEYVGNYIVRNYDLPNHKDDSNYEKWNSEFAKYEEYVNGKSRNRKN